MGTKSDTNRQLSIHGIYRHFKGNYYIVEGVAKSSEDPDEELVIYRPLYGDSTQLWARPKEMFLSLNEKDGQKYRFELVDELEIDKNGY